MKAPSNVRELTPAEHNPRSISDQRSVQLAKSMAKFGDLSGIVFNRRTNRLVCGHQRVKHLQANAKIEITETKDDRGTVATGAIREGKNTWSYRAVDWDEDTEKAACVAANAQGGDFDDGKLRGLVLDLDKSGFDLDLLGLRNLSTILESAEDANKSNDDESVSSGKAISKRGDVWICGEHRVMCGDSTSTVDIQKLMGHDRAACVFTDPPYGVSYKGADFEVIEGDHKRDDELFTLVVNALTQCVKFAVDAAAFYIWHASSTRREFDDALRDAGLVEKQYLIWVKNSIALGRSHYQWAHEPCYYAAKQGHQPAWHGDRSQPTTWRVTIRARAGSSTTLGQAFVLSDGAGGELAMTPRLAKGKKSRRARLAKDETIRIETSSTSSSVFEVGRDQDYVHPTQKPVELARIAICNSTKPGAIVLDVFGGSGTTMIACEAAGRKARLCELDPKYVDAQVLRWEIMTGRKAEKEKRA